MNLFFALQPELILNVIGDGGFTIGFVMHKAHNYIAI